MSLHIRGARVVDPAHRRDGVADVYVAEGRIAAIGRMPKGFRAERCIAAKGHMVLPGLVDLYARLREPGKEDTATIAGETRAAAGGGITRMVCPPDTHPVIDTQAMAHMLQARAAAGGFARLHPLGALTAALAGERLADMALLQEAGCVGVNNGACAVEDALVMRRAMQYAATYHLPVFVTPQDPWLRGNGVVHEGEISTRLGLPAIPEAAETVGVARELALTETSGARTHFVHLSTARAVEMIAEARTRGLAVSASVAIHHLHCNEQHIGAFDTAYKVFPPLRTARDQATLLDGVRGGTISAICSDHQPHGADAKLAPFAEAAAGISAVDTLLTLTMALVEEDRLPLATAVAALTANPAAIIGVDAGHLGEGATADLCLYDPRMAWVVDSDSMLSNGKNTPWRGAHLRGRVVATVLGGEVVYER